MFIAICRALMAPKPVTVHHVEAPMDRPARKETVRTRVETFEVPVPKLHEALGIIRNEGGFVLQSVQVGMVYRVTVAY